MSEHSKMTTIPIDVALSLGLLFVDEIRNFRDSTEGYRGSIC